MQSFQNISGSLCLFSLTYCSEHCWGQGVVDCLGCCQISPSTLMPARYARAARHVGTGLIQRNPYWVATGCNVVAHQLSVVLSWQLLPWPCPTVPFHRVL